MLKFIDIFGDNIKLNLKQQEKIKTSIGGIFTILTLIAIIIFSCFIGNDIVYKSNPLTYSEEIVNNQYDNNIFDKHSFPFSVGLLDSYGNLINDTSYIKLELTNYFITSINGIQLTNKTNIELKRCVKEDFPELAETTFLNSLLPITLCPNTSDFNVYDYRFRANKL
jgi:hypothetical protein